MNALWLNKVRVVINGQHVVQVMVLNGFNLSISNAFWVENKFEHCVWITLRYYLGFKIKLACVCIGQNKRSHSTSNRI